MNGFTAVVLGGKTIFDPYSSEENYVTDDRNVAFELHGDPINNIRRQPYQFDNSRYYLVFNGRLYDYSNSPEEEIAMLFLAKGTLAFQELRGMFSLLIWDSKEMTMYGARDQFGMQSLYYMEWNEAFIFLTGKLDFLNNMSINIEGLQHYFTYQYIPNPLTLSKDLYALKPGNYFIKEQNKPMECYRYFHAEFSPINTNREEIKHEIRRVITDSVHLQMQTEKPLGSFLSGGIDSSILVAIAKDKTPNLKTFSVGFDIDGYYEIEHAKRTADRLGVENISYVISPEEFVENITKIVSIMDDPLADPSCVPLYIAAREAKKYVSVVLSGEGADELFGGYNIYCEPFSLMVFNSLKKN